MLATCLLTFLGHSSPSRAHTATHDFPPGSHRSPRGGCYRVTAPVLFPHTQWGSVSRGPGKTEGRGVGLSPGQGAAPGSASSRAAGNRGAREVGVAGASHPNSEDTGSFLCCCEDFARTCAESPAWALAQQHVPQDRASGDSGVCTDVLPGEM